MPVAYYMDENVESAISRGLKRRGVDVLTIQDDGRLRASDDEVLDRATALDRVVFTRDEDFLVEAARRQALGIHFAGVVYAHKDRVKIGPCIFDLELISANAEAIEMYGKVEHLPI